MKNKVVYIVFLAVFSGVIFYLFQGGEKGNKVDFDKRHATTVGSEFLYPSEVPSQPRVLFHGAGQKLDFIEPKSLSTRSDNEGDVVFATSHLGYATLFTFSVPRTSKKINMSIRLGSFDGGPLFVVCNNKKMWMKHDQGGYIHAVSSESFYVDLGFKGMTRKQWMSQAYNSEWGAILEWVSKEKVPVLYEFKIENTLNALLRLGVQMFFFDDETFKKYQSIKDEKEMRDFMRNAQSENEIQSINYKPLWNYGEL